MPHRALPRTELERLDALEAANRKLNALGPEARRALRPGTRNRLASLLPRYRQAVCGRQALIGHQTEGTASVEAAKARLRLYVAHFLEALNRAIARGKDFRPGDRTFYGLAASQETLPRLRTLGEILEVAMDVVRGEGERIAAGGQPITMPSVQEVAELLETLRTLVQDRKRVVTELDGYADAVSAMREDIDDLIRDIWDELDFAHRKEEAPARRRRLREWGVVFETRRRRGGMERARDGEMGRRGVLEKRFDGGEPDEFAGGRRRVVADDLGFRGQGKPFQYRDGRCRRHQSQSPVLERSDTTGSALPSNAPPGRGASPAHSTTPPLPTPAT